MANTTITPASASLLMVGLLVASSPITNFSWAALGANATGNATPNIYQWKQAKVTVSGTYGPYGSAIIQGSNDASNWVSLAEIEDPVLPGRVLHSSLTGGLTINGNGLVILSVTDQSESYKYLRATTSGGDGTTAISVNAQVSSQGAI